MKTVTAHEVAHDIDKNEEEWMKGQTDPSLKIPLIKQVHLHGMWLENKLKEAGATQEERSAACFALGQRLCENPSNHYAQVAAEVWNRWEQGDRDIPGRELAMQLIKENSY